MIKRVLKLLGLIIILATGAFFAPCNLPLAPVSTAYAGFGITNSAGLSFTDSRHNSYAPVSDTAAIFVLTGPTIHISKDVRNIRSGETSPDVVSAMRGDSVEFILTILNSGDTEARRIIISDTIPVSTVYETGSAFALGSLDPLDPPDTVSFLHIAGGNYDLSDTGTVIAIKWQWDNIDGIFGNNRRVVKFKVKVQ